MISMVSHFMQTLVVLQFSMHVAFNNDFCLWQANVGSVMDQLDTLMILKEKFETDVKEHGPDPTVEVEKAIQGSFIA